MPCLCDHSWRMKSSRVTGSCASELEFSWPTPPFLRVKYSAFDHHVSFRPFRICKLPTIGGVPYARETRGSHWRPLADRHDHSEIFRRCSSSRINWLRNRAIDRREALNSAKRTIEAMQFTMLPRFFRALLNCAVAYPILRRWHSTMASAKPSTEKPSHWKTREGVFP